MFTHKASGNFNEDDLVLVKKYEAKYSLEDFEVGIIVELNVGGPDMWILAIHGEEIECGWIVNDESYSELFSYKCLNIKESEYK